MPFLPHFIKTLNTLSIHVWNIVSDIQDWIGLKFWIYEYMLYSITWHLILPSHVCSRECHIWRTSQPWFPPDWERARLEEVKRSICHYFPRMPLAKVDAWKHFSPHMNQQVIFFTVEYWTYSMRFFLNIFLLWIHRDQYFTFSSFWTTKIHNLRELLGAAQPWKTTCQNWKTKSWDCCHRFDNIKSHCII